jgi:predicted nucleic acid-binding protein
MALAKVGGLRVLFRLFPKVLTPPAVYEELITAGQRLGAPDAALLESHYRTQELLVIAPEGASLPIPALLGSGEEQSIVLAIEQQAVWLLMDDLDARHAASANLGAAGVETRVKGTLGVLLTAREEGHLSNQEAMELIKTVRQRRDIWISDGLCDHALELLQDS